jgi:hypothetical protein
MASAGQTLTLLAETFAICRLGTEAQIPAWALEGAFVSITRTDDELSIVCMEADIPLGGVPHMVVQGGWRCLKVDGPLDFALTGVLAALAAPLARADVSLFALSTYDTDYLLVKAAALEGAIAALEQADHTVR